MKSKLISRLLVTIIAVVLVIALAVLWPARSSRADVQTPAQTAAPVAATVAVERGPVANSLTIAGEFLPWQEVELHGKVAGYLKRINVDIGDHVRAGQTLAVLEVPELNAQVEGAAASVRHRREEIQRSQDEVERAKAAHAALHAAYDRLRQASESRPGLIAQQELDDAMAKDRTSEAQVDAAKSALSAAMEQLQVSQAAHQQVSAMQDYSHIVAPFDGVVTWRYADTGALIQAGTSNASSMPVVKVAQISVLRLRIPVPESVAAHVKEGDTAQIRVQATGEQFDAKVARFTDSLDPSTRTMQVEFDIPNKDYKLAPGMYADVTLQFQNKPNVLTLPVSAVHGNSDAGSATVLLVDSSNHVEKREIKTGVEDANRAEIVAGLHEGDRVIVGSVDAYQPGELVVPKASKMASAGWNDGGGAQ